MRETLEERFWSRVTKLGPDSCWPWVGPNSNGYGALGAGGRGRTIGAHRASWQIHYGPIPDGLQVLHRCDNRPCVNPAHLFLGTNDDNIRDMVAKQRNRAGDDHHWAKLTADQVRDIRERHKNGTSQKELSIEFGVADSLISRIVNGLIWKRVR